MSTMRGVSFLLLALIVCSCSPIRPEQRYRYVWPPSVQDAKIEYLGFYASEANLKTVLFSTLSEVVLGVEPARPIFLSPFAVDARFDRLLVTDTGSRRVMLFDFATRTLETLTPQATSSAVANFPAGVAIVDREQFLLTNSTAARVERYSMRGEYLGAFGAKILKRPLGLAIDRRSGRIAVADSGQHALAIFSADGTFLHVLGEKGSGEDEFNFPLDADFDDRGDLFVLDGMNVRVKRFAWNGAAYEFVGSFGERGTAPGSFARPKSLAISASGHVYVTDALSHKIVIFDRDGRFLLTFGGQELAADGKISPGGLYMPAGIAADEKDGLWVVDSLNRMVHHFQYLNEDYLRERPLRAEQLPSLETLSEPAPPGDRRRQPINQSTN